MMKISKEILKKGRFLVTSHVEPDGDAVGSTLAMYHALLSLGKEAIACFSDPVPPIYRFLPGSIEILDKVPLGFIPECVIVLDCSDLSRTGSILKQVNLNATSLINIDHHVSNSRFGDLSIVKDCSSTGELIYDIIRDLGVSMTREMGICIYTAILTDTGGFRYRNTTQRSLQIAADIVGLGINPGEIAERACESYPLKRFQVLGEALRNLRVSCDGKIADFFVTRVMFNGNGISPAIVENFVNYPREINGVLVSVFFRENGKNQYRVSIRSKGDTDVSAVAQYFGGGGHRNAAGCLVEGDFETVRGLVIQRICETVRGGK